MKKYIYILFFTLGLFSCNDFLSVDSPTNYTTDSNSPEFADQILTSTYNGAFYTLTDWFNSYSYPGYRSTLLAVDALGYDMVATSGIYGGVVTQYGFQTNNTLGSNLSVMWRKYYNCIDNCNKAIIFYKTLKDPSQKSQIAYSQILALRSLCYLDIVRLFQKPYEIGKDLPVCPKMTEDIDLETLKKGVKLSTVAEIYEMVITNLLEAKVILKNENYTKSTFAEMDVDVVSMLLARAYLTRGTKADGSGIIEDMNAAVLHAADIRNRKKYTLMSTTQYKEGFNEATNPEFMWGLQQLSTNSSMSYVFHYLDNRSEDTRAYYKNAVPDPYFKKLFDYGSGYDTGDVRLSLFNHSATGSARVKNILTYNKFKFRASEVTADIVYMRCAEAWLIEAEAKLRGGTGGTTQTAQEIVTELRNARGASIQNVDIDFLLQERRREFWGEGVTGIFDITRTQATLKRQKLNDTDFPEYSNIIGGHYVLQFPDKTQFVENSPYYFFQIPEVEIINNPAITEKLPR